MNTVELPIAGHGYGSQTLPLIFDFVNIANKLPVVDASKIKDVRPQANVPLDEESTLRYLRQADKLTRRMTGKHHASLGLLPAIYFYSLSQRHQPTAVLAVAALIMELDSTDKLIDFTCVRENYEQFLVDNKQFINQLTVRHGSMAKGYRQQKEYMLYVLERFIKGKNASDILRRDAEPRVIPNPG